MVDDDDLVMYILVVARTQKLIMACKYDEVVHTNPSCDEDFVVVGRYPLLLWCEVNILVLG
jgi:hypothetical protein